jgi:phage gp29-like protein
VDIQAFGAGVKSLTDAGCKLSQNWVRNRVGAVAPENDDDEMGVESPEPETSEPDDESDPTGDDSGQPPPGSGEGDGEPAVEPADVTPD